MSESTHGPRSIIDLIPVHGSSSCFENFFFQIIADAHNRIANHRDQLTQEAEEREKVYESQLYVSSKFRNVLVKVEHYSKRANKIPVKIPRRYGQ
jgi:hypothetical protein